MRVGFLERPLSTFFYHYSSFVVANPGPFIIIPIVLTAVLSVGLLRYSDSVLKDELDLYTPTNAQARKELLLLDSFFHINDSDPFYASRRYDIKRVGYVIVTSATEEGDILSSPDIVQSILELWRAIQSITIFDARSKETNYMSICVKFPILEELNEAISSLLAKARNDNTTQLLKNTQLCVSNPLVELFMLILNSNSGLKRDSLTLALEHIDFAEIVRSFSIESLGIRSLLGGITIDPRTRRIAGAKALMLPYALKHSTGAEDRLAEKWELVLANFLNSFQSPFIRASWWTYETLASESARDRDKLKGLIIPCFFVIFVYTVLMCCTFSSVHSRPLYAICGVVSVLMAVVSGVGMLLLAGLQMTSVVYSIPFIVFSVGVDNIFILLSSWRATDSHLEFRERVSSAFRDAAVSITITSVTDLISFAIGYLTPYPSVKIFCVYAVVTITFTYFYFVTFLTAIFALTSAREVQNRHCLTMIALPKESDEKPLDFGRLTMKTLASRISLTPKDDYSKQYSNGNHVVSKFFREQYANFLLNSVVCYVVILLTAAYLIIAFYGCLHLQLGMDPNDLLPEDSYGRKALKIVETYFPDQGDCLHVVMHNLSSVNLGHRRLWIVLEREIELYEFTDFTRDGDSWLREFLRWQMAQFEKTTDENFILRLRQFLDLAQYTKYQRDVVLSPEPENRLLASRVPVRLRQIGFQNQSRAMLLLRRIAETSELPTFVYADFFMFAEQHTSLVPETLSSVSFACAAVVLVCLVCIPEPAAAVWVSLSVLSINLGTLGFMTFWSVRLDFISMVTIVTSVGFCVDFSAHMAHNYSRGNELSVVERTRNALYSVGTPILQSASSTIIGISFLVHTESYIFRSFFKTMLLVMILGIVHGLVILPVFLTMFGSKADGFWNLFVRARRKKVAPMLMEISAPISSNFPHAYNRTTAALTLNNFNCSHFSHASGAPSHQQQHGFPSGEWLFLDDGYFMPNRSSSSSSSTTIGHQNLSPRELLPSRAEFTLWTAASGKCGRGGGECEWRSCSTNTARSNNEMEEKEDRERERRSNRQQTLPPFCHYRNQQNQCSKVRSAKNHIYQF